MSNHDKIPIDVSLVQRLIAEQFPEWAKACEYWGFNGGLLI